MLSFFFISMSSFPPGPALRIHKSFPFPLFLPLFDSFFSFPAICWQLDLFTCICTSYCSPFVGFPLASALLLTILGRVYVVITREFLEDHSMYHIIGSTPRICLPKRFAGTRSRDTLQHNSGAPGGTWHSIGYSRKDTCGDKNAATLVIS